MRIVRIEPDPAHLAIETTGARFELTPDGAIAIASSPEPRRAVARLELGGPHEPFWITEAGADVVRAHRASMELTWYGDSLLVLRADAPCTVPVTPLLTPLHEARKGGHRLFADEIGGVGVYGPRSPRGNPPAWTLRAGEELRVHPFPPRVPHPVHELSAIAHEGRPFARHGGPYPSDATIADAARHCDVFALHAYFWKDAPRSARPLLSRYALRPNPWRTARHEPSDPDEFLRVRESVHRHGMRLVVYMSPRYSRAPDFAAEATRVLEEYRVDGLYLDGIGYDVARAHDLMRRMRRIVGPGRILYLNASDQPLRTVRVPCFFIDAHADFVLRGDSGRGGLARDDFLRYAVSGRNTSNAVGVWCHYGSWGGPFPLDRTPPEADIAAAARMGVRLWRRSHWGRLTRFDREYDRRKPDLRGDSTLDLTT